MPPPSALLSAGPLEAGAGTPVVSTGRHWLELVAGLLITLVTLSDIFVTILVPGPNRGFLRIGARLNAVTLPIARALSRRQRRPGGRPSNSFAPFMFVLIFATWMLLLLGGYGLLFQAVGDHFSPRLGGFDDAVYFAGSSLLTLGVSEVDAHGPARWLLLAAGLSGFAVITATLTFVLQIQNALHQRETRVLTLGSLAGTPPSGIGLLEAVATLESGPDLHAFFREWRDWAAAMLHSHIATPMLIFFSSVDEESDWLASLEAVLDAATLLMALTTNEAKGAATLMHRGGSRTAARLCALLQIHKADAQPLADDAVRALAGRLAASGYAVVEIDAHAVAAFERLRGDYAGRIACLAQRLGADRPRALD